MFEIKVIVDIPDLVKAAQILAGLKIECEKKGILEGLEALKTQIPEAVPPYNAPAGPVMPDPTPVPDCNRTTAAPVPDYNQTTAATAPTPVVPPVAAPTAAPAYTLAQVAKAGAELLTGKPALIPQLQALLKKYGAQTAQELPLDRLGEFAAELRAMGARI